MTLVSPGMMRAVRKVGETGLVTELTILTRTILAGTNGNEDTEEWAATATVKAWIMQNDRGPILHFDERSGAITSIGRYRIQVPYDTVVEEGDMLGWNGEVFMANEVTNEDSYNVFLTIIARKRE